MRAVLPRDAKASFSPKEQQRIIDIIHQMEKTLDDGGKKEAVGHFRGKKLRITVWSSRDRINGKGRATAVVYLDDRKLVEIAKNSFSRALCEALRIKRLHLDELDGKGSVMPLPSATPRPPSPRQPLPGDLDTVRERRRPKPPPPPPPPPVRIEGDKAIVHGVVLKRAAKPGPLTPTKEEISELRGLDDELKIVALSIQRKIPVLLYGDTGTGKTALIKFLAYLCNANLVRVIGDPEYGPSLWLGHLHSKEGTTRWVDGDLPLAMRGTDGMITWLFVDELSRMLPDNTSPLLPVLERNGGKLGKLRLADNPDPDTKIVTPHEDFWVAMAMNPFDADYVGTHEVDKALSRRAGVQLELGYPNTTDQAQMLQEKHKNYLAGGVILQICKLAELIRQDRRNRRIAFPCSPDELDVLAELIPQLGLKKAAEVAILNKASIDDRPRVQELISKVI